MILLGKLTVPGYPTNWMTVGKEPIGLAEGVGGVVWTFFFFSSSFLFYISLSGIRPDID